MPTISNLSFNVQFDLTGAPSLVLTDTTTSPPVGFVGIFEITQPDGYVRSGDINSPDIVGGGTFSYALRLDSSGGVQCGTYTIKLTGNAPGYLSTDFTRSFYFDYAPVTLNPTEDFNPFVPFLGYTDNTNYTLSNYYTNSVVRSWSVTSTPTGTITSALPSIDLIYDSSYWAANYSGTFSATISYTNTTNSWLSIYETLSVSLSSCVSTLKTIAEMTDKVNDLLNNGDNCDSTNENFEKGQTLVSHFIDQLRLQQIANISQYELFNTYKKVLDFLWNDYICQPNNNRLTAYDFADYVNSSIYTDSAAFGYLMGNNVDLTFTFNHNLNTDYPVVQIYDAITKEQVLTGYTVTIVSSNTVSVTFDSVPTTNQYIAIVHSGADHLQGREVQLRVDSGYIQWKYDSDLTWTNLVALDDLTPKINAGTTTSVNYDQPASVTNSGDPYNVLFNFQIPKGVPVQLRSSGGYVQWKYASDVSWTNLIAYSDINTSINIGSTSVLNPNQNPTVSNSGTDTDAIFNFSLPRASAVSVGSTNTLSPGSSATVSNSGSNGDVVLNFGIPKGDASTITVGTTTTGAAGSSASVTNSGTSSAAVLNFTIPKGDTGATGAQGPSGSAGAAATISVGSTTTGSAGSSASVTNSGTSSAAVLDFVIPKGDTGATGATGSAATVAVGTTTTGAAGSSASVTNSGTSSAATLNFTIPRGNTGAAATISVGTTTTGAAGSSASVTNSGTSGAAVLDFTIPQGATGATGSAATVAVGSTTTVNPNVNPSVTNSGTSSAANFVFSLPRAATVAVGTTTTGAAGSSASVTNTGTNGDATLNFTIPKGDTGATGAQGPQTPSGTLFSYYNFI